MSTGPGLESRILLGVVIFSGVLMTTLMTLFVVPVVYKLVAKNTTSPEAVASLLKSMQKLQTKENADDAAQGVQV